MACTVLLTSLNFSLAIMGLWICFNWKGMIFEPLAKELEYLIFAAGLPAALAKPLWQCPTCMSSCWAIIFYAISAHHWLAFGDLLLVVPATAFLCTIFCCLLGKISEQGC